jgi:hypothetical protein
MGVSARKRDEGAATRSPTPETCPITGPIRSGHRTPEIGDTGDLLL